MRLTVIRNGLKRTISTSEDIGLLHKIIRISKLCMHKVEDSNYTVKQYDKTKSRLLLFFLKQKVQILVSY